MREDGVVPYKKIYRKFYDNNSDNNRGSLFDVQITICITGLLNIRKVTIGDNIKGS